MDSWQSGQLRRQHRLRVQRQRRVSQLADPGQIPVYRRLEQDHTTVYDAMDRVLSTTDGNEGHGHGMAMTH